MKTILIYGDSLVYGKMPKTPKRYERSKNFIGVIEKELGHDYRIIDEGLRARTLSGENGFFSYLSGVEQFGPLLESHLPLDFVCIFLGVNDCNKKDTKTSEDVEFALEKYLEEVKTWCESLSIESLPKVMIIVPPAIRGDQLLLNENMFSIFGSGAEEKYKELVSIYQNFCEKYKCVFFDASKHCVTADEEGIHLDENNNALLGVALANKIKEIL